MAKGDDSVQVAKAPQVFKYTSPNRYQHEEGRVRNEKILAKKAKKDAADKVVADAKTKELADLTAANDKARDRLAHGEKYSKKFSGTRTGSRVAIDRAQSRRAGGSVRARRVSGQTNLRSPTLG
jgi:hypothetical protein